MNPFSYNSAQLFIYLISWTSSLDKESNKIYRRFVNVWGGGGSTKIFVSWAPRSTFRDISLNDWYTKRYREFVSPFVVF